MGLLSGLEGMLRGLVEGVSGRAFGGALQPAELSRRLMTEQAATARTERDGATSVANVYRVGVSQRDASALANALDDIASECAAALRFRAAENEWRLPGPIEVRVELERGLATGQTKVVAERREGWLAALVEVVTGPDAGRWFESRAPETVVGRAAECAIALADPDVSRKHCAIHAEGESLRLEDLGSTNGTYRNGKRVLSAPLKTGDTIELGSTLLKVAPGALVWRSEADVAGGAPRNAE